MLDGEGGDCTLNGLYLADRERLVDNHTTIDHAKPHCGSHEVYKGILGGTARAVFNGKIIVRQDAQKTDAKQTNRALLLTDGATINTKPQLEIFADDVKCTHGAAIGQLDDDAIFYLRARGLTYAEARDMLIHAFAGQMLERRADRAAARGARSGAVRAARPRSGGSGRRMTVSARPRAIRPSRPLTGVIPAALDRTTSSAFAPTFRSCRARCNGKPLVYLDNAATTQKPRVVLDAMDALLRRHQRQRPSRRPRAERAGDRCATKRRASASGSSSTPRQTGEIVFTRNATEGINLVAQSFVRPRLEGGRRGGDLGDGAPLEHRAVAAGLRARPARRLRVAPIDDRGALILEEFERLLGRTRRGSCRSRTCRTRSAP